MSNLAVRNRWTEPPPRPQWLPDGKTAAVVFSIDDVHPVVARDPLEPDAEAGALGRLAELQRAHPELRATLCVTPDFRLDSLVPGSRLRHIPFINRHVHWTRLQPEGLCRLGNHPEFVAQLKALERCEIVPHGLTHAHAGPQFAVEFQNESEEECMAIVQRGMDILREAEVPFARGYVPPAWNAPPGLIAALGRLDFEFFTSGRDLRTPVTPEAVTGMSGLSGVSLIYPEIVGNGLVHLSCNFQGTSPFDRATAILELGGVLHIKAHTSKAGGRQALLDGLDRVYMSYLDRLFMLLKKRFGEHLWWPHLSEVAGRVREAAWAAAQGHAPPGQGPQTGAG